MIGGDEGPHFRIRGESVPDSDRLGGAAEPGEERLSDLPLQEQPGGRAADLPGAEEDTEKRMIQGGIQVGVGKDDEGALAPSSSPIFFVLPAAACMIRRPVAVPR